MEDASDVATSASLSSSKFYSEDVDSKLDNPFNRLFLSQQIEYLVLAIQFLPKKRKTIMNKVFFEGYTTQGNTERNHYKLGIKDIREKLKKWGIL